MNLQHEEENARIMIQMRKLGLNIEPSDNSARRAPSTPAVSHDGARCHVPIRLSPCRACWNGRGFRAVQASPTTTASRATSRSPREAGRSVGAFDRPRCATACTTTSSRRDEPDC